MQPQHIRNLNYLKKNYYLLSKHFQRSYAFYLLLLDEWLVQLVKSLQRKYHSYYHRTVFPNSTKEIRFLDGWKYQDIDADFAECGLLQQKVC